MKIVTTKAMAKVAAVATGLAMATSMLSFAPMVHAAALTSAQVQSVLGLLTAFGADSATLASVNAALTGTAVVSSGSTTTTSSSSCVFTKDYTIGSSGPGVMCLQQALIAAGFSIPAGATGYFGVQTQAAVAAWQATRGITPAVGYFGPISRAAWNLNAPASTSTTTTTTTVTGCAAGALFSSTTGQSCTTTTTTTTTSGLAGGEGTLLINSSLGDVEVDVDEGDEDVKVLGAELEASDSDLSVERVDVDITVGSGGSAQLSNYISEVSLWLDSTRLATLDVDEGDEDSNDVFSFRFTGLNGIIREDDKANLYVAVSAISNVDSGDTDVTLDIDIPTNGIRAVDAAGISETYVDASPALDGGFTVTTATGGDVNITEGDDNPDSITVQIDENEDTDNVLMMEFDLEVSDQDVTIDDIPVGFVAVGADVDGVAARAILTMDGDVIDTVSIPSTAGTSAQVVFDDLNIDMNDGDTATFQVLVDLNDADITTFATGTTMYATTTGSSAFWDVEDSNGDNVVPDGSVSNASDGVMTFETAGIQATFVSASAVRSFEADASGEQDVGEFKIVFDVTAFDEDVYLDRTVTREDGVVTSGSAGDGFMWATTTDSTVGTTTGGTASISVADADAEFTETSASGGGLFRVSSGQTERFTLTVLLDASDIDGFAAVKLTALNWTTFSTDTTPDEFFLSDLSDFKTENLNLNTI